MDISNSLFNKLYKFCCRKPKKSNIFSVSLKCAYYLTTDDNLCFLHTEREAHLFVRFVYNALEGAVYCSQKILPGDLEGIIHPSQLTGPFMSLTSVFLKLQGHCNIKKLFIFSPIHTKLSEKILSGLVGLFFLEMFTLSEVAKVRLPHGRN